MDLGSHDGALIQRLLEAAKSELKNGANIVATDPSAEAIKVFSERSFEGIEIERELHSLTTEDYFANEHNDRKFDWVFSSHSLYWTKDLNQTVANIVAAGKKALIVLRGLHGIYQLQNQFKELLGNADEKLYTSDNIQSALVAIDANFERQDFQTKIEVPSFDDKEFLWLVSFFLQTKEEKLSSNSIQDIKDYVAELGMPLRHDVSFFWITQD